MLATVKQRLYWLEKTQKDEISPRLWDIQLALIHVSGTVDALIDLLKEELKLDSDTVDQRIRKHIQAKLDQIRKFDDLEGPTSEEQPTNSDE